MVRKTNNFVFTVFTPTYNRAGTLHRVYESLRAQTFRDFEWLVIDDGSADHTEALIRTWQREADFPVRYIWQHNQGKHIAFNRAVQEAMGELFLTFDSDDACVPNALERFYYHWQNIPPAKKSRFSAVTALCKDEQGQLIGDEFPQPIIDSDSLEMRYKYKTKGEKWGFQRTEVLKQFPFPTPADTLFVVEGMVWSKIALRFKTRFVNEALRIYHHDKTGTANQLTQTHNPAKYAKGHLLWHQSVLNDEIGWFLYSPWAFIRSAVHYSRFAYHARLSVAEQFLRLRLLPRIIFLMFGLTGFLVFLKDKNKS